MFKKIKLVRQVDDQTKISKWVTLVYNLSQELGNILGNRPHSLLWLNSCERLDPTNSILMTLQILIFLIGSYVLGRRAHVHPGR